MDYHKQMLLDFAKWQENKMDECSRYWSLSSLQMVNLFLKEHKNN